MADPQRLVEFLDRARTLPGLRAAKALALQRLRLRPGQRVVDVGAGTGEDAVEMARQVTPGGGVLAVEPSRTMRAEAVRRRDRHALPIEILPGRAENLPLPDHSVDACRADTVLTHIAEPPLAVDEMVRVARPGVASYCSNSTLRRP